MQSSATLDSKKLNLMQLIMAIDTESMIDKLTKSVQKMTGTVCHPADLSGVTKEMMENSRKEYAEGHVIAFNSASEAQKWMETL